MVSIPAWQYKARYTALQKGMSIVLIIRFDTLEKILNFYYYPYIKNMTIDDSLHPFLQSSVHIMYIYVLHNLYYIIICMFFP